ncbi:MAG: UbiH/UbiF/VisC/COQ6 family ubiquinone biosynthesis hydroxylase [Alphaproteobacteria bacterium]
MRTNINYDVLIAGGGLAGLGLACLLGRAGVKTICIDAAPGPANDMRTTAISFGSQKILEEAGIWENLEKKTCPIDDIKILDGSSPVLLRFLKNEMGGKSFGWICENADLKNAAIKVLKKHPSITYKTGAAIKDYEVNDNSACAVLQDGSKISASLVVGADGRNSFTREWMDVKTRSWSYTQAAIICSVQHEHPHHNTAVEHFRPGGPFAILPMADDEHGHHRSAIVFTEHTKNSAPALMSLSDAQFEMTLMALFPDNYGDIKMTGKRASYSLSLVHTANYIGPRMVLVADAAHAIHPVAGQGLNLGFRDVKELAGLISEGGDPGSDDLLQTYQRRRRPDNTAFVAVTDGLVRLFANDRPGLKLLRRAGLKLVSRLPAAKRFFMARAMGEK